MTEAFKAQMRRLVGLKFQPASLETHWEALRNMPEALLAAAVSMAQHESEQFPSPSELEAYAARVRSEVIPLGPVEDRSVPIEPREVEFAGKVIPFTREWRFYCDDCSDTGWKFWWCGPGASLKWPWIARSMCGRSFGHDGHEWASRCACAEGNPAIRRRREIEMRMAVKRTERSK